MMPSEPLSQALSSMLPVRIPETLQRALGAVTGLSRLESLYQELAAPACGPFLCSRLLKRLQVRYRLSSEDRGQFPQTGATIIVANHPFGILDGAILLALLLSVRRDVKVLGNRILNTIPELAEFLIPIDTGSGALSTVQNIRSHRRVRRHLSEEGLLVVFPAGEVSHFQCRHCPIEDSPWSQVAAKIATARSRHGHPTTIVPVHISGSNSILFQIAGLFHPMVRTLLLARELLNKAGSEVILHAGTPISSARLMELSSNEERTDYLRWRTYLLADRSRYKARTARPLRTRVRPVEPRAVIPALSQEALSQEIVALGSRHMLTESGDLQVYLARATQIPTIMAEIGRLRELAFRAAGEGTGKSKDIDRFDACYLHLFLWNPCKREVVGAYLLIGTDMARRLTEKPSLYTATLFKYREEFLEQIDPALELGRSFIRLEYQRSFAPLLLLWRGIGKYLAAHPQYKILFGAVSISGTYGPVSRELMVSWLERRASLQARRHLVASRCPFRRKSELPENWLRDIDDLSGIIQDIDPEQRGVPVLLRQYLKLGGKLLAFNIDAKFSRALDGLVVVDLTQTEVKLLKRYLGEAEAEAFLRFHDSELRLVARA